MDGEKVLCEQNVRRLIKSVVDGNDSILFRQTAASQLEDVAGNSVIAKFVLELMKEKMANVIRIYTKPGEQPVSFSICKPKSKPSPQPNPSTPNEEKLPTPISTPIPTTSVATSEPIVTIHKTPEEIDENESDEEENKSEREEVEEEDAEEPIEEFDESEEEPIEDDKPSSSSSEDEDPIEMQGSTRTQLDEKDELPLADAASEEDESEDEDEVPQIQQESLPPPPQQPNNDGSESSDSDDFDTDDGTDAQPRQQPTPTMGLNKPEVPMIVEDHRADFEESPEDRKKRKMKELEDKRKMERAKKFEEQGADVDFEIDVEEPPQKRAKTTNDQQQPEESMDVDESSSSHCTTEDGKRERKEKGVAAIVTVARDVKKARCKNKLTCSTKTYIDEYTEGYCRTCWPRFQHLVKK